MIVSRQNPKLKSIRRLRQCKGDHALLEGPHLVAEACRLQLDLESVLATPEFLSGSDGRRLAAELPRAPLEVAPAALRDVSDVEAPQGILAVARLPRTGTDALPSVRHGVYLFVEGLQDPGNLGALARSLEAAGGSGLALGTGSVHPNHPRALRASAGSLLRIPVARQVEIEALDRRLGDLAPRWLALAPRGGADLWHSNLDGALVLALGAEASGLSPGTLERCESALTIDTAGGIESLNAAVAAALALFEIRRRRTA